MTGGNFDSAHLTDAELAALIFSVGQDRDIEQRAYSHLAICAECTTRVGVTRESDRATGRLLSVLDVAVPPTSAATIIRAAQRSRGRMAFGGRRAAAAVALLVGAAAVAAAVPASPLHRLLVRALERQTVSSAPSASDAGAARVKDVSPAVSFVTVPGVALEIGFNGSGVGGTLDVHVVDGDHVSLSSSTLGAIYRVSTNRIVVEQSVPGRFQLAIPRSVSELRVRVGGAVVFDRQPSTAAGAGGFRIQLNQPHAKHR